MSATVLPISTKAELLGALDRWPAGGRAILLAGGADRTEAGRRPALRELFVRLARHCEESGTAVLDGGTDTGVMRLIAEARTAIRAGFPLIGVAPRGVFERPTRTGRMVKPARDHTLVLLVPGSRFGDETDWLFAAADHVAGGTAPMIVVNGGQLTLAEARRRLDMGHVVIAVAGTGRTADDLADDEGLRASGRLRVVSATVDAAGLAAVLTG